MKIEIRSDSLATISGYVNAVERDSKLLPSGMNPTANKPFIEKVKAGTFAKAIQQAENIDVMFNHYRKIGKTSDGTLKLKEDSIGLYAEATITDKEVISEAKRGNLTGWSFGFMSFDDEVTDGDDGVQHRTIRKMSLKEVSILTLEPAYIATSIEVRADSKPFEKRGKADSMEISYNDIDTLKRKIEIEKERFTEE